MGYSHPAKEVSHKSTELSAVVSILTIGAGIVGLITVGDFLNRIL